MMKRFSIFLIFFLQCASLLAHGFSADTLVLLADNTWQQIGTLCSRVQKKHVSVATYNTTASFQTIASAIHGGYSRTNCYIRFGFDERFKHSQNYNEVVCTPTQEFYSATTLQWIPAYMLQVGDTLLCADNKTKTIAYVSLVKESLRVYTLQIKHTHTFFVTHHSLLTHNMVLPIAFNIGLSVPMGAVSGGTAGSFFGPPTIIVGAAIGCFVGVIAKLVCGGKVPSYTIDAYNIHAFEQYMSQQPEVISEKSGCGDTASQEPFICMIPAEPISVFQSPGYDSLSDDEREMLFSNGCTLIPIPESEKESAIICGGIILISFDVFDSIKTMASDDGDTKRYDGPTYNRTEDWIKNNSLGKEFERTNKGMQGKRAFRLKKKIPGLTGIFEGEMVVVDALHKDHLEVYNKHGQWIHVANFDGSKNEEKTEQGRLTERSDLEKL